MKSWVRRREHDCPKLQQAQQQLTGTSTRLQRAERDRNNGWALLTVIHQLLNLAHQGKCEVQWDDNGNFCLVAESIDGKFNARFEAPQP